MAVSTHDLTAPGPSSTPGIAMGCLALPTPVRHSPVRPGTARTARNSPVITGPGPDGPGRASGEPVCLKDTPVCLSEGRTRVVHLQNSNFEISHCRLPGKRAPGPSAAHPFLDKPVPLSYHRQ
jgi:hypothetical protein